MTDYDDILGLEHNAVRLRESTPKWQTLYETEAREIQGALGDILVDIEHFGSTSISGIKAKPILDILVAIANIDDGPSCIPLLEAIGYEYAPEAGIPGDYTFGKGERRTHLVHVVAIDSRNWRGNLKFRDTLRSNPALASEYEALKVRLSEQCQDRAGYTAGKSEFVLKIIGDID